MGAAKKSVAAQPRRANKGQRRLIIMSIFICSYDRGARSKGEIVNISIELRNSIDAFYEAYDNDADYCLHHHGPEDGYAWGEFYSQQRIKALPLERELEEDYGILETLI